jgi:hypothetical protein
MARFLQHASMPTKTNGNTIDFVLKSYRCNQIDTSDGLLTTGVQYEISCLSEIATTRDTAFVVHLFPTVC